MFNQQESRRNSAPRPPQPSRPPHPPHPHPPRPPHPPQPPHPPRPPQPPHPPRPPHPRPHPARPVPMPPPPPRPIIRPIPIPVPVPTPVPAPPVPRPPTPFSDYGPAPYVVNIEKATLANDFYRQTLWTGPHLQSTLMSIPIGGEIGLEVHPDNDQFLRLEQGQGLVQMGDSQNHLTFRQTALENSAVFVPAGTWHNITNIGTVPMKLYAIYAPPHHPHGTVHPTKAIADAMGD